MKTIFNTYIEVTSQEQADRLKQVCVDNGLPIWDRELAFEVLPINRFFQYDDSGAEFWIMADENKTKVTEPEWMELLTKYKEENGN